MLRVAVAAVLLALLVKVPAYSLLGNAIRHGRRGSVGNGAVRSAAESSGDGASPTIININMENAVFVTAKSDDSPSSVLRKEKAIAKSSSGGGTSKGFGSSGSSGEAASEKKGARSEAKRKYQELKKLALKTPSVRSLSGKEEDGKIKARPKFTR